MFFGIITPSQLGRVLVRIFITIGFVGLATTAPSNGGVLGITFLLGGQAAHTGDTGWPLSEPSNFIW